MKHSFRSKISVPPKKIRVFFWWKKKRPGLQSLFSTYSGFFKASRCRALLEEWAGWRGVTLSPSKNSPVSQPKRRTFLKSTGKDGDMLVVRRVVIFAADEEPWLRMFCWGVKHFCEENRCCSWRKCSHFLWVLPAIFLIGKVWGDRSFSEEWRLKTPFLLERNCFCWGVEFVCWRLHPKWRMTSEWLKLMKQSLNFFWGLFGDMRILVWVVANK